MSLQRLFMHAATQGEVTSSVLKSVPSQTEILNSPKVEPCVQAPLEIWYRMATAVR